MPRIGLFAAALTALTVSCSFATRSPECASPASVPPYAPPEIESVLFLLGDAGATAAQPTIEALDRAVGDAIDEVGRERVSVIFLGDNVYPWGVESPSDERGAAILRMQLEPLSDRGVAVFLVPGNHDSKQGSAFGRVDHQREIARRHGARLLPDPTCSGPQFEEISDSVRAGFLDLQHLIRAPDRVSSCETSLAVVRERIDAALPGGSGWLVLAAHHPLRSGGRNGGHFTLREQMKELFAGVWIRRTGINSQDLSYPSYRRVRRTLAPLLRGQRVIWVAGHEHNFQYFSSPYPQVISGGAQVNDTVAIRTLPGLSICSVEPGFSRIDFAREGPPRLAYIDVEGSELLSAFIAPE